MTLPNYPFPLAETDAALPVYQNAFAGCLAPATLMETGGGFAGFQVPGHPLLMAYVSSCRRDNRMIYVSPQIANLGFAPESWLENADLRLQQAHEDDYERLIQAIQHSRSTGENFDCHYRLYDSRRNVRWFHDEASVVCDETGTPVFISGAMLDITDKKEMEAELYGLRHHLERHVENRTQQLMKRTVLLESCNATLGDKLASAQCELAALKQQSAAPAIRTVAQTVQTTPINDGNEPLNGISDWARNMISWRVAAAGEIA